MLVLTRKQNEKVRIGDSITVTVLRMKGKGVRLGIEAPQDVNVIRGELCFEFSDDEKDGQSTDKDSEIAHASQRRVKSSSGKNRDAANSWPQREIVGPTVVGAQFGCSSPLKAMVDARTI